MERVRNLFTSRKSTSPLENKLQAQAYDGVVEGEAPIMGSMPVVGNGPAVKQLQASRSRRGTQSRRQSTDTQAAPSIRRERRDSYGPRPSTAPSRGRSRTGFSMKAPPDFSIRSSRKSIEPPLPNLKAPSVNQRTSSITSSLRPPPSLFNGSAGHSVHNTSASTHIDLFDAVSVMSNHTRNSSRHRAVASGRRDFGEDVADRNIADHGSGDINLYSPQYSYLKNFYAREAKRSTSNRKGTGHDGSGVNGIAHTKAGSALTINDDDRTFSTSHHRVPPKSTLKSVPSESSLRPTTASPTFQNGPEPQNSQAPAAYTSSLAEPKPAFTQRTSSLTSTTSRDFHYPTNSERARTRSLARSPPPAPSVGTGVVSTASRPTPPLKDPVASKSITEVISPLVSSAVSTKSYIPSRGRSDTAGSTVVHTREPSTTSVRSRKQSVHNVVAPSTRQSSDIAASVVPTSHHRGASSSSNKAVSTYTPTPPLPKIDFRHLQSSKGSPPLPTPPMSPSAQPTPPTTHVPQRRGSSDKLQGHSRSRGNSATYTIFPPPAPSQSPLAQKRASQASNAPSYSDSKDSTAAGPQILYGGGGGDKRKGLVLEGSNTPPNLNGIVDLTNTVDTDRTVTQAPAVVHEFVQPTVHHHTEERITREIHTHDVFHRVLPVIDVEVLPTKHYIPDPHRPGMLKEIPESAVPARQNNWQISITSPDSSGSGSPADAPTIRHRAHDQPEPTLSSKKEYITKEGVPKTEYVWRHAPVLEPTARELGETQPVRMNCIDDEEYASSIEGEKRRSAVGEESLLFNDQGYGAGGMLPGLKEKSPIVMPDTLSPSSAAAAGSAPKRAQTIRQTDPDLGAGQATDMLMRKREERLRGAEKQVTKLLGKLGLDGPGPKVPPK